jgi:glycosyltransferase involved in cell wall biosynthesis
MATFNGAKYIGKQLESFASQTVLPAELVVADDCSVDETVAIITDFAATASFPVRIERNTKQLGYKANFMKVAGLCRSQLIAFSDQDDVWLPQKLQMCLSAFDKDDVLLAYHNATVVAETLEPICPLVTHAPPEYADNLQLEPWHYGLGFTMMFKSSLLAFSGLWPSSSDFRFQNEREAHDQWFFFLASCLGSIVYIKDPQVLYRQHTANTSGWRESRRDLIGLWKNVMDSRVEGFRSLELAARNRATVLEAIMPKLPDCQRHRARLASDAYQRLAKRYRLRREMYTSDSRISRVRQLLALLYDGTYMPKARWGVGRKALVRDAICNVLFKQWIA